MGLFLSRNIASYVFWSPLLSKNMVCVVSRTDRQLQRYDNKGCRQVAGCIPYRYRKIEEGCFLCVEDIIVLVISSQKGQGILFPKGGWELDESIEEAANRETFEEAGVTGHLEQPRLGKWSYKGKNNGIFHEGYMFPLLVDKQFESWPEKTFRKREWMTIAEAKEACQNWWMREALDEFVRRQTQTLENKHRF